MPNGKLRKDDTMNHEQAFVLAVAPYAESFTNTPIIAAAALDGFADELTVLRHACRSKRFTGAMAAEQGWRIAHRLRATLVLDGRIACALPLVELLENAADDMLASEQRAPESFVRLLNLLANDARRMCRRIVKADPSSTKPVMQ
jgi:hypothetical protein